MGGLSMKGKPRYNWPAEEHQRLIDTYNKHGWKMGYYMDFGCSYMTCKRELERLGLLVYEEVL
jgi:uncharacterized protein CbrC (UPF0167 family)